MPHLPWSILSLVLSLLNLTRMSYIFSDCPHLDPVRTSQPNRGNVFSHKFKIFKRKYAQMYLSTSRWFVIRQEHIHTYIPHPQTSLRFCAWTKENKRKKRRQRRTKDRSYKYRVWRQSGVNSTLKGNLFSFLCVSVKLCSEMAGPKALSPLLPSSTMGRKRVLWRVCACVSMCRDRNDDERTQEWVSFFWFSVGELL